MTDEAINQDQPATVAQLIEALGKFPPGTPVDLEGCDCVGAWSGEIEDCRAQDGTILLKRIM